MQIISTEQGKQIGFYFYFDIFSYLVLAIIRYVCCCLGPNYRIYGYFKKKIGGMMILILSISIIIPAIMMTLTIFVGGKFSGRAWHFQFSSTKETVVAFQKLARDEERTGAPIMIAIIGFHFLQFVGTISCYCKILYIAYMSTTRISTIELSPDVTFEPQGTMNTNQVSNGRFRKHNRELEDARSSLEQNYLVLKTISYRIDQQGTNETNDNIRADNVENNDKISPCDRNKNESLITGKCNIGNQSLLKCKDHKSCRCDTKDKLKTSNKLRANKPTSISKVSHVVGEQNGGIENLQVGFNSKLFVSRKQNCDKIQSIDERKKTRIKREAIQRVDSDSGKKIIQPKLGDRVVSIPRTNVVLCISRTDVICTIALACQLSSLVITFILTIFGIRIAGKIVTIHEYFLAGYFLEIALIINSVVDPIICVVFSSDFRDACKRTFVNMNNNERKT